LDSVRNDAEPKVDFAVADMLLDEEMSIPFNLPKPEFEPLSGDFMGINIAHLVELMNYLKEMIDFLPKEQKTAFDQSDIRIRMEHVINTFMGRRGILREIQDSRPKQQTDPIERQPKEINPAQAAAPEPAGQPDAGEAPDRALNAVEIADFLTYLGSLSSSLPDFALTECLTEKIKTVVSAMQ
jgi:hypothetical protein